MLLRQRFRFPEFLLGILLAISIFAMGMTFASSFSLVLGRIDQQHQSSSQERGWNWLAHDAGGFFTFWLVLVGIGQAGLFFWQLKLIKSSLKPAEDASKAAKVSADAVIAAERAYVFIEITLQNVTDVINYMKAMKHVSPRAPLIQYRFTNHGKNTGFCKGN